jgi:tRNA threonylcarbamoyladenosine biosynthesis protein TsaE
MTRVTYSEAETAAVGRELAASLCSGDVIVLSGDLGAGKTAFVRGVAEGLGVDPADVTSPTFTLIQVYRGGRLPMHHVDLYRLKPAEADDLGLDEIVATGVTAIEWPDRWERLPATSIEVRLEAAAGDERRITVRRSGTA